MHLVFRVKERESCLVPNHSKQITSKKQNKNCTSFRLVLPKPVTDAREIPPVDQLRPYSVHNDCSKRHATMLTRLCQSRPILEQGSEANPTSQNSAGEEYLKKHNYKFISQTIFSRPLVDQAIWRSGLQIVWQIQTGQNTLKFVFIYIPQIWNIKLFSQLYRNVLIFILKDYLCSNQLFSAENESVQFLWANVASHPSQSVVHSTTNFMRLHLVLLTYIPRHSAA